VLDDPADRVAVVTGGASGIGKAIASELLRRGMTVVIADIEADAIERAVGETGAIGMRCDVGSAESVASVAADVKSLFGRVDLFCSNAGVASTGRIEDMTDPDWDWLLGVNLYGVIHGIRAFLPLLREAPGGGHLAVTASMSGLHATPGIGGYTVTKYAVMGLCETLALELESEGANVGLTLLCPGPVSTNLGASQRNRRRQGSSALVDSDLEHTEGGAQLNWLDPAEVAGILLRAIERGDLYAFTHPEWEPLVAKRHRAIEAAFERAGAS